MNGDSPDKNGRIIARSETARSYLRQISVVLLVVSLSLAALISWTQFLILIVLYFMSFIYSFPPIRFKRYLMSPLLIGLGTFFAFIYGALTPYSEININYVGPNPLVFLTGTVIQPDLPIGTFLLGFYMFVGLVIGSMVTDIDGYEEDRISGVKTIYTKYGLKTGTKYVSALVLLSALTPLAIMSRPLDLLIFPALGAIAAYLMYRQSSSHPVMALAIVGLIYSALRYGNFLG